MLAWFTGNARDLPWRNTRDPYAIWISEVMLQQTQIKTVIPYWGRWMRALPTVRALAQARPSRLYHLWEGLGYYLRVRHLHQAAQIVVRRFGGKLPRQFDQLLTLPGIGRYTAGALCSIAFEQAVPVVDGNVTRVLTRIFGLRRDPRKASVQAKLWELAQALVGLAAQSRKVKRRPGVGRKTTGARWAQRPCGAFNQSLMELGATICTPRNPRCDVCPVAVYCQALWRGLVHQIPPSKQRQASLARRVAAFIVARNGRVLVRHRLFGLHAQLWELPNFEPPKGLCDIGAFARQTLGIVPLSQQPVCSLTQQVTRFRFTVDVYRGRLVTKMPRGVTPGVWLTRRQLRQRAFARAHRKILVLLGLA